MSLMMKMGQQTHDPLHCRPIEPVDLFADFLGPETGALFALHRTDASHIVYFRAASAMMSATAGL